VLASNIGSTHNAYRPPNGATVTKLHPLIESWTLALESENKAPKTIEGYLESMGLFDRWLDDRHPGLLPEEITPEILRTWLAELGVDRRPSTVKTRWGGLRQFWAWCLDEGEIDVNPMEKVKAPIVPPIPVPLLTGDQVKAVLATCEGASLLERRDQAILLLFLDTGARLTAIATARLDGLDLRERTLVVQEKGRKQQVKPFGAKTARALDRWLRIRGRQKYAESTPALFLSGKDGKALTANGVQQMLRRRGNEAGIKGLHAHLFRHGFAHAWLSSGGSEGDLMELAGWNSRQMLTRYAAISRGDRAREAYRSRSPVDRLDQE
jgi:integrase/recombinase XerC